MQPRASLAKALRMRVSTLEYVDSGGANWHKRWFDSLNPAARTRVTAAIIRMQGGNLSNLRGVGNGVHEFRIHSGPGYRIYLGRDGDALVILLGGEVKARQQQDIEKARRLWAEYKSRKRTEA